MGISESSDNESSTEYVPANPGFSAAPVFSHLLTVPCCSPQNRPGFLALTYQSTYSSPQSSLPLGLEAFPVQCWYLPFAGLHAWPVSLIHILEFALYSSHSLRPSRGRMLLCLIELCWAAVVPINCSDTPAPRSLCFKLLYRFAPSSISRPSCMQCFQNLQLPRLRCCVLS